MLPVDLLFATAMHKSQESTPSYGILERTITTDTVQSAIEQINHLGYAVLDPGFSREQIDRFRKIFDATHDRYVAIYGEERLRQLDEFHGIRLPLAIESEFLKLAKTPVILNVVHRLIQGKFVLNQQNGIINPPGEKYNQAAWHRDLPYQHFVSSRPIAINALYCVDDFTLENGATHVLPASHKREAFPSEAFVNSNEAQVQAPAGSFILLDCMCFHRGGFNQGMHKRRAVNHLYTIPLIRQQIDLVEALQDTPLTPEDRDFLGMQYFTPKNVAAYLDTRKQKTN